MLSAFPFVIIGIMAAWQQRDKPSPERISQALSTLENMSWKEFLPLMEQAFVQQGFSVTRLNSNSADLHLEKFGKTTLVSGHSGVGKSSFINYLFPDLDLNTQEVSDWSGKGMHTTTFAQMYDLPVSGSVIDTPGMRELGLVNLEKEELAQYFPEMREKMEGCQFNNCQHINEPGCAVKAAVEKGIISEARFFSYVDLWHGIEPKKY
jgi:ribosome biogenesis GTPase